MLWLIPWIARGFVFIGARITQKQLVRSLYWASKELADHVLREHIEAKEAAQCAQSYFAGPGVEYYY